MVVLLLWWSLACVAAAISNGATNNITVLSDGNKTDCFTNSSGTFCYSLSYAMNHLITDDTTVLLASPKIDVLDHDIIIANVSNLVVQGLGVVSTTLCYYRHEIVFWNISRLRIVNLTIKLCETTSHLLQTSHSYLSLFNCSNVTIDHVKISRLTGGLNISLPRDDIHVTNVIFEHICSDMGGAYVNACHRKHKHVTSKTQCSVTFEHCVFHNNSNTYNKVKSKPNRSYGHGGGLVLMLYRAIGMRIHILNCSFTNNRAGYGGGLFMGMKFEFTDNTLIVKDTVFVNNTASLGGGGLDVGFFKIRSHNDKNIKNSVTIENVAFHHNSAGYGGGCTIFSDLGYQISHKDQNKATFRNITWINNLANFSTAVDVSPNVYDNFAGGFPVITEFYDCKFINNAVLSDTRHKNATKLYYRTGTLMITAMPVVFGGKISFIGNVGTGLHVVAARVTFCRHSNVIFDNNTGSEGGALALAGMATLVFNLNSTFWFVNNYADFVGGAIYWYSVDQHDFFSSHTCFLKKDNYKTNSVFFTFINNTAHSGIGHSIFATTLRPCRRHSYRSHHLSLEEIFKYFGSFSFLGHYSNNNSCHIATSGKRIKVNSSLSITPGIVFHINAIVYDEGNQDVSSITVFRNYIIQDSNGDSTIRLASSYKYSSLSEVKVYGEPGSTGKLLIKTDNVQGISTVVDIKITHCPPGFVLSLENTQFPHCKCQEEYSGITCRYSNAYIHKGYWAGYLDVDNATGPTSANLWTAECPLGFCNYDERKNYKKEALLPKTASTIILDNFICGSNRTGELCGQCRDNFSVFFHSKFYTCKQVSHLCNYGMLFYIII